MSFCESRKYSMILLIFINLLALVTAQDNPYGCVSNGNYTSNGTYRANLNTLLASLSSNISDYGFYSSSVGQNHDTVNGLALCRGDQIVDQCRACVQSAASEILQSCPNQKQAIIWYEYCMLRYSNDPIYDTKIRDRTIPQYMLFNVSNGDQFRDDRARLLRDLQTRAVNGSSALKIGAGNRYTSSDPEAEAIYALVQCIPDLSLEDCGRCLTEATENMQNYISTWMRVLMPNCNIHYELTSFYNETRLRELGVLLQLAAPPLPIPSPPPSPPRLPPGTNAGNTRRKKHDNRTKVVIILVVSIGATLIFFACAVIFLIKGMKHRSHEITESIDGIRTAESLLYDFGKIRAATNDFNDANKLGQGGFGAVYRGKLPTGVEIAVKRLSKDSGQGRVEFKNEVLLVAKLQHKNLVRLLGFSTERTERVLVYEFVQNGSLDQFIFDPIKRSHLNWDRRYKIIEGIVRGLLYLHEDSRVRIIHRDLKASNILLDGDMNPKIADFGMARLFRRDETHGNTSKIAGTYGYMSPEYAQYGEFSIKSDVFSFGVLLLEIISGESINSIGRGESDDHLLTLTWRSWREGTAANMIDPDLLRNDAGSLCKMLRCIHIGLLCVQENAADRPTMTSIVVMLRRSATTLPEPSEPSFYMGSSCHPEVSILHKDYSKGDIVEGSSQNEMSLTELYPR